MTELRFLDNGWDVGNLHGFEGRSNALVGDCAHRCWTVVWSPGRLGALRSGQRDEGIPVPAAPAPAGPFNRFLLARVAHVGDDDALLEVEGFFQFDDGLFHVLLSQEQVGHDFMVVHHLILRTLNR